VKNVHVEYGPGAVQDNKTLRITHAS
jgi:hypothetical protein